jgi:hypothetical protein
LARAISKERERDTKAAKKKKKLPERRKCRGRLTKRRGKEAEYPSWYYDRVRKEGDSGCFTAK